MTRAGREPAEDVKRRLVVACQEVGLTVTSARMHLITERGYRFIHVEASPEQWSHDTSMVTVAADVPVTGQWPETIDIRCNASDENSLFGPWMKGRDRVPFEELIAHRTLWC